jgi:hypothetical protein
MNRRMSRSDAAGSGEGDDGPVPGEGTLLEYSRSGGFAPSTYEVAIDQDGRAVVSRGNEPGRLESSLPPDDPEGLS